MISKLEENKILNQIYRWFSFYENTSTLEIQRSILSNNISIDSGLEKIFGLDEYLDKINFIPKRWISIYNLKSYEIEKRKNGSYIVETIVEYDNIGVEEDMKSIFSYIFSLKFEKQGKRKALYPLIQSVKISTLDKGSKRLKEKNNEIYELLTNLFVLIGINNGKVEGFEELLGNGFILDLNNKKINTMKMLKKWTSYNTKEYQNIDYFLEDVERLGNNRFEIMINLYTIDRKSNESENDIFFNLEIESLKGKIKILNFEKI